MQREQLKDKWLTLGDNEKEPFEKKTRDHLAKQGLMKECIVDALQKAKGGNCSRSYSSLAKVMLLMPSPVKIYCYVNVKRTQIYS